jgi:predicted glycogen debranching enzyme
MTPSDNPLPEPLAVDASAAELPALLASEWLLANRIGAYASSTVVGCNTRRYHGLLVAATKPPAGRVAALSSVMEQLGVAGGEVELATNEFDGAFSPQGSEHLAAFRNDVAPTFVFRAGGVELTKQVMLADSANAVALRYTLRGGSAALRLRPMVALRDYHHLRRFDPAVELVFRPANGGIMVEDRSGGGMALHLACTGGRFEPGPHWWYRFCYRAEIARGQDGFEDLYTPGVFLCELAEGESCQLTASLDAPVALDFDAGVARRRERLAVLAAAVGDDADDTDRRLALAGDAFVVTRSFPDAAPSATILAGYHWFADWGRDAFVALPGLLLATRRFEEAREVFRTFASHAADGLIPNRFDDYAPSAHYNSIDASLWFVVAAERYLQATGDVAFWREVLLPAADGILAAYRDGTRFDIRADGDTLLAGGSEQTQLTWMDAKLGEEVVTPRHGKAVEVNALWHSAHRIMAQRCRGLDDDLAGRYDHFADLIARAFRAAFWNDAAGCLFDCISDDLPDATIRANQIFAVSLPHSALRPDQQAAVVRIVERHLLTPVGLRSLSPEDPRYRRRCGGSWQSRDRAYHQGTVWPWLIGAFVEAYLKVEHASPFALDRAREILAAFDDRLAEAGIGFLGEIHDGDAPHAPRGCIAQAWSVGEVLRAKRLVRAARAAAEKQASVQEA